MEPLDAARALFDQDASAAALGIELIDAGPGGATVRMTVRPDMCNGFRIIHGGMTFLLADSAMAFASNSEGQTALATSAEIDWLLPVEIGQVLTATAEARWSSGRTTVWDVTVTADDGVQVGLFRGRTRKVGARPADQANSEPR